MVCYDEACRNGVLRRSLSERPTLSNLASRTVRWTMHYGVRWAWSVWLSTGLSAGLSAALSMGIVH
jgi:hypothetical protein